MMHTSEAINEIAAALARAQAEITPARRDSENPHFRSRYADLSSVWDSIRQPLSKHGVAVVQSAGNDDTGNITVTTMLMHSSGQWIRSSIACKPAKFDAQAIGSLLTYLRRYGLAAMCGVAPDDDDGEAAAGRPPVPATAHQQPQKPKPTPEQLIIRVPMLDDGGGPDWGVWQEKMSLSISRAPDLESLTQFWAANRTGLAGFLSANEDGATKLQAEYKSHQAFFAGAPRK